MSRSHHGIGHTVDKTFVTLDFLYLERWHNLARCYVLSLGYFERLFETASRRPGVSVGGRERFSMAGGRLYVADLGSMRSDVSVWIWIRYNLRDLVDPLPRLNPTAFQVKTISRAPTREYLNEAPHF